MTNPSRSKVSSPLDRPFSNHSYEMCYVNCFIFMQIKLKTLFDKEAQVNSEIIYSFGRDPHLSEGLHDNKKRLFDRFTDRMTSYDL